MTAKHYTRQLDLQTEVVNYLHHFLFYFYIACLLFYGRTSFGTNSSPIWRTKYCAHRNDDECFCIGLR